MTRRISKYIGIAFIATLLAFSTGMYLFHEKNSQTFVKGSRIMIIAPHPDDESLASGGFISRAVSTGKTVKVIFLTNGDGYREAVSKYFNLKKVKPNDLIRLGIVRRKEATKALATLGLNEENIVFMGYPDSNLMKLWERNWLPNSQLKANNGKTNVPYNFAFKRSSPYNGASVVENLKELITAFQPTDIIYPNEFDDNSDHIATNCFVRYALAESVIQPQQWGYLVHRNVFPLTLKNVTNQGLNVPSELKETGIQWSSFGLTKEEQALKLTAIRKHFSQVNLRKNFLEGFARKNEIFSKQIDPKLPIAYKEPKGIVPELKANPGADFIEIGGKNADHHTQLYVKTKDVPEKNIKYMIRARIIYPNQSKDVEAILSNLKLQRTVGFSKEVKIDNHQISYLLSDSLQKNALGIMMNAVSLKDEKFMDKSAWRYIDLSP